ncbi:MAG: endonuclease III [Clostridia bacterium]|nr:endonuclease III [Clostridia bacterium]
MCSETNKILAELERLYPDARPELHFSDPFQTLIATILSAQCTDQKVNQATPALFAAYPNAAVMAKAEPEQIEPYIRLCGIYRNKARNIVLACRKIMAEHKGQVPGDMEALTALPGVGRKTANVVMANAFGAQAIAVDTHVFRVSNRLGLAQAKDVLRTEEQLMEAIPREDWSRAHLWIIYHGRRVCRAIKPDCAACTLADLCAWRRGTSLT